MTDKRLLQVRYEPDGITINIQSIEGALNRISEQVKSNYHRFNITGPFILRFAMLDINGANFLNGNGEFTYNNVLQNDLIFPEVMLYDIADFESFTNKVISLLYNAAGYSERPRLYR